MTISGNTKVITKGAEGGTNGGSGIRVDGAGGVLTIKDNATVEADGATSGTTCGNGISSTEKTEILGSANVTARGGSGAGSGGYGLVSYFSEDINIGTATEPFSGTLTAIGGKTTGALRKDGTAFRNDAKATSFLNTMHYHTYNDGTGWMDIGTGWMDIGTGATSLPTVHYDNLGIGLGMTLLTVTHIPTP